MPRRKSSSSSSSGSIAPEEEVPATGLKAIVKDLLPVPIADRIIHIVPEHSGELSKKWVTHVFLLCAIIVYNIIGAVLYSVIEGRPEAEQANELLGLRKDVISKIHELITTDSPKLLEKSEALIKVYEGQLVEHYGKNSKILTRGDDELNWSFWGSAYFCGTVYTLIGSPHVKPLTVAGRALTILYALIGIPLFLTLLADFGKMLTRLIKIMWLYVLNIYNTGSLMPPKGIQQNDDDDDDDVTIGETIDDIMRIEKTPDDFNLPITLALAVFILYIFFGAVLYYLWEPWTFFESFYFVFITMATIGFGDYIPSTYFYMMTLIAYLTFGLAITSMCINVVQEKISDTFAQASAKLGETVGIEFADELEKEGEEGGFSESTGTSRPTSSTVKDLAAHGKQDPRFRMARGRGMPPGRGRGMPPGRGRGMPPGRGRGRGRGFPQHPRNSVRHSGNHSNGRRA